MRLQPFEIWIVRDDFRGHVVQPPRREKIFPAARQVEIAALHQYADDAVTRAHGQASGLSEFAERHWTPGCLKGFEDPQRAIGRFHFSSVRKEICYFESSLGE